MKLLVSESIIARALNRVPNQISCENTVEVRLFLRSNVNRNFFQQNKTKTKILRKRLVYVLQSKYLRSLNCKVLFFSGQWTIAAIIFDFHN